MRQIAYCVALICFALGTPVIHCQATNPVKAAGAITVTGILIVSDSRCDEWPVKKPKDKWICPDGFSQWGLITEDKQYAIAGQPADLRKFERRRVTVTGRATAGPGIAPIDNLEVQSIASSDIDQSQIREAIDQLRSEPWNQPENMANPTMWQFHLTPPMIRILQAGPAAQDVLLEQLSDPQIKDQIIFLLGGVGDGRAVEPIIDAMAGPDKTHASQYAQKVNFAANLALTNITVSEVIWHHGGGITVDRCPDDPKSCWSAWWGKNKQTFDVSHTANRRYSNYPNYGIYQDPSSFRSEEFLPEH